MRAWRDAATRGACTIKQSLQLLTDQFMSLYLAVSPMIGGDGLFSFNSKLAVLVSEPDVQIKKVRHAHLILVNLPLHISPACQFLCDSNHHRHMPLLCTPLWAPTPPPLRTAVVVFFYSRTDIYVSLNGHCQKWNSVIFPKITEVALVREGYLICSSTFRRMLNTAADGSALDWTHEQQGL